MVAEKVFNIGKFSIRNKVNYRKINNVHVYGSTRILGSHLLCTKCLLQDYQSLDQSNGWKLFFVLQIKNLSCIAIDKL
jgi:hypothetical protein